MDIILILLFIIFTLCIPSFYGIKDDKKDISSSNYAPNRTVYFEHVNLEWQNKSKITFQQSTFFTTYPKNLFIQTICITYVILILIWKSVSSKTLFYLYCRYWNFITLPQQTCLFRNKICLQTAWCENGQSKRKSLSFMSFFHQIYILWRLEWIVLPQ